MHVPMLVQHHDLNDLNLKRLSFAYPRSRLASKQQLRCFIDRKPAQALLGALLADQIVATGWSFVRIERGNANWETGLLCLCDCVMSEVAGKMPRWMNCGC